MERIKNVFCIEGIGNDSNCYLIDNILVDTGTGINKSYLHQKIEEACFNIDYISLIVNTHCHFDHIGGNYLFPNAKVAVHEKDARFIRSENDAIIAGFLFGKSIQRHDVDIELKENDKISSFEVIHTPGHTPGGISLWDGEILISGDTVFANGGFGRLDIGGNSEEMSKSLEKIGKLNVEYLFPAHGPWTKNGKKHVELAKRMFQGY